MNTPGEAIFVPVEADYIAANRANLLWAWRRPRTLRAWVGMIALMAGLGALFGWLNGSPHETVIFAAWYAALGLALMPVLYAITYALAARRVGRLVRQQPSARLEQRWRWSEDVLSSNMRKGRFDPAGPSCSAGTKVQAASCFT